MPFDFSKINIWAVLVSALLAFMVGGIWYTAIFGKLWIKLHGYSEEKMKEMQAAMSPPKFFGGMLLSYLVLAWALAVMLTAVPSVNASIGIIFGLLFWVASSAIQMTGHIASDKRSGIYLIDIGCQLVYLVALGALLGAWQ